MKFGLVSLGCDKNTVDSERILATLIGHGAERAPALSEAEIILVNTCGFIDAAKEESIETLLQIGRLKEEGKCRVLVAVGCLVERYRDELEPELPEVDLFVGLRDMGRLLPELRARGLIGDPIADHPGVRMPLGSARHVRYLKVSEGCNHGCAFCAIPIWRGRHRSFGPEQLVAEAQRLEAQGAVELNLVAQDLAHYGLDLRDGTDVVALLRRLLEETTIPWFRLLYIYSAGIREPLVELLACEPRILPYVDMPIQHASDEVLKRMRRPERQESLLRKIGWMRSAIPDLTLRTTVMVGFPGETDEDFRTLLDFMEEVRFDRLGAFAFSPQPGTRAAELDGLFLPPEVGKDRLEELLEVQRAISAELMAAEVGRRRSAIVDGHEADLTGAGREREPVWTGRTAAQADDVDGLTLLHAPFPLVPGDLVDVQVTAAADYDLQARVMALTRPSPARNGRRTAAPPIHRSLPVAPLGLEAVWGR
ncbi:MAG: 30S ribosomal protein S12 methylthiotransferase RimO [Gemmatimonadota bacterium]